MWFENEIRSPHQLKKALDRLIGLAGGRKAWKKRSDHLEWQCATYPYLEPFIRQRHAIELEVPKLWRAPLKGLRDRLNAPAAAAASLAFVLANVYDRTTEGARKKLRGSVRDSLQSKRGFLSLDFELTTAGDLMRKGFDVEFVDLEDRDRFDLLLRKGSLSAEAECKCITYDRGRKIHRHDFHELGKMCFTAPLLDAAYCSRLRIDLILDERLPPNVAQLRELADALFSAVEHGPGSVAHKLGRIQVETWDITATDPETIYEMAHRVATEDPTLHVFASSSPTTGAAILLAARSRQADRIVDGIYDQIKHAAADQLSGSRPAFLFVHLEDLNPAAWHLLRENSALATMTQRYFASPSRAHVHSILYSSESALLADASSILLSGTRLFFKNDNHESASDPEFLLALHSDSR